jgi:ribosome maturation factor RimP
LRTVIEPVVAGAGYDLEDLSVSRAGRRHVVRVIVGGETAVSLDAVADVSRAISVALDQVEETEGDIVAGEYQLEVSSPGVDRPLTLPRHWRRNVGRLVKVTAKGAGGLPGPRTPDRPPADRQLTGRVVAADDERVVLDLDGARGEWAYADLGPGRVQVEFSRLDEVADEELHEIDDTDDEDEDVEGEER